MRRLEGFTSVQRAVILSQLPFFDPVSAAPRESIAVATVIPTEPVGAASLSAAPVKRKPGRPPKVRG